MADQPRGYTGLQGRVAHSERLNKNLPGTRVEEKEVDLGDALPTKAPVKRYRRKQSFMQVHRNVPLRHMSSLKSLTHCLRS